MNRKNFFTGVVMNCPFNLNHINQLFIGENQSVVHKVGQLSQAALNNFYPFNQIKSSPTEQKTADSGKIKFY